MPCKPRPRNWMIVLFAITASISSLPRHSAADIPATAPAAERTLNQGTIRFTEPADWHFRQENSDDKRALYVSSDERGLMSIAVANPGTGVSAAVGAAIIQQLMRIHQKNKEQSLIAPHMETVKGLNLVIHDKYKSPDGKINDEMHLYRRLGPDLVLAGTVNAMVDDTKAAKALQDAAINAMRSARYTKPK